MGHSIRSKIKKRLRTAKRQRVDAMIVRPRLQEHAEAMARVAAGRTIETRKPKNAFLYPNAPDAVFPQHEIMKPIDFRAENLPMAGYAFRGNRRKYEGEQKEYMHQVATATHPEMEVMAGGGAILASTKQRVSTSQAELIAAAAQCAPKGDQLSAASAVAAAVSDASASGSAAAAPSTSPAVVPSVSTAVPEPAPEGEADTSRRPVMKDARRQQRAAEHRPRPNSIKKKNKGKRSAAAETAEPKAASSEAAGSAAKSGGPPDGDVEMKPAAAKAVKKVKKKGKAKAA